MGKELLLNTSFMAYEAYRKKRSQKYEPAPRDERLKKVAITLGLSDEAKKRLEWILYYEEGKGEYNAARTARYFGIGVSTFFKWYKQFDELNLRTLETKSKAPKKRRGRECTPLKDQRVIDLRKKYPYWGKMKLKVVYEREHGEEITSWYIQRVIEHYNLYFKKRKKKPKTKKNAQVKKRISECQRQPETGFLLHLDSIVLHLEGTKRYIVTAIDDHSKIAYARMYTSHASLPTKDFFDRLYYLFNAEVKNVHTDNGCEFHKHFKQNLENLKLPHFWSRSRTPKDNPSNERFNRTLKEEFLYWGNFNKDPEVFNKRLTDWLVEYNAIRPHESLNYLTPLQFAQTTKDLSTMWSSCTTT